MPVLPPGPRPRLPGVLPLALARDRVRVFRRLAAEHGDVAGFTIGRQPIVLLSHPNQIRDLLVTNARLVAKGRGLEQAKRLLGEGLLTSEGELHLRQRRLAQPAFHRERIAGYGETMIAYAEREAERWRDGETLEAATAMTRLTLAIAARTLFDADVEGEAAELGAAITDAVRAFDVVLLPFGEWLERLPIPAIRRFDRARARLDATIYRLVAERRREGTDRGDLLSMLLLARDEDGGPGMTDLQLRDELMTLFLAGHETTANMLTWTWHLLGTHPDVERRLHAELDAALGGRPPTAGDVARLPYARQVIAESLRLYPPAWILGRRALAPYPVAGFTLPPGTLLFASQLVVQRDGRWWPDPERFDPDRWAPGAEAERPRFAYFPFGAGTRVCIGEQFAWTEGVLVLAAIARRWRLRPLDPTPPAMRPSITLRPRGPVRMRVERRK